MHVCSLFAIGLLSLFITSAGNAQTILKGRVADRSNNAVSFATVGLRNSNTGVNANEDGTFSLSATDDADTLVIYSVGHKPASIPLRNIAQKDAIKITMEQTDHVLSEVRVIARRNSKEEELNKFRPDKIHKFVTSSGYETQMAQHFSNEHPDSRLKKVLLYLRDDERMTSFRLRIYAAGSNGKPGDDIFQHELIVHYTNEMPLVVDVDTFGIYPGKEFFVAVEWLKIAQNESSPGTFHPIIGFSNKGSRDDNVWRLNYRNEWYQRDITIGKGNLAISAVMEY